MLLFITTTIDIFSLSADTLLLCWLAMQNHFA